MTKLQYEKNNTIKILKNELSGINQLIDILEQLLKFDFNKFNNKVVNVRLENEINKYINAYARVEEGYNGKQLYIMIKDRYNAETKSYIGHYTDIILTLGIKEEKSPSGKEKLDAELTRCNIQEMIDGLVKIMIKLENEFSNIDSIILEIEKLNELVAGFNAEKSSFLLDQFKSIRNYY